MKSLKLQFVKVGSFVRVNNALSVVATVLALNGAACVSEAHAQSRTCSCMGATVSYNTIQCSRPNGETFNATQICWTRKVLGTNESCGTVCEAAINVCAGRHGFCSDL
jgi:hypothetical protein